MKDRLVPRGSARAGISAAVACAIALFTTIARVTVAEPINVSPISGVVLLRNGEVLHGTITRTGDYYHVSKPGTEIRLKASEVDKVAASVAELYIEKRRRVVSAKLADRLELAEWCIEQRLIEQANVELAAAAAISPNHPKIALLRRRIAFAGRIDEKPGAPPIALNIGPTTEELDRFVRGLPPHTVESFTSSIQPLLVNNCTTSGCHGPRSTGKLRLLRLSLSGPANRRVTQRNLHAVWQTIDAGQPAASPLLTQPIRPHGKAKGPIFSGHGAGQYRQLVTWVYEATRQRRPQSTADGDQQEPSLESPRTVSARTNKKKKGALAATNDKKTKRNPAPPPSTDVAAIDEPPPTGDFENKPEAAPPDDSRGDPPPRTATNNDDDYEPVDPFDAEVFNRRYLRR